MIRGIHYFSAEVKTKIDVIPRGCFNICQTDPYVGALVRRHWYIPNNKIVPFYLLKYVYNKNVASYPTHHKIVKYVERLWLRNSVLKYFPPLESFKPFFEVL